MMRFPLLILAISLSFTTIAQEHCDTPDEGIADPNSITKCAVEEVKDADGNAKKQVSIEVSTRRRVVRKNKAAVALGDKNSSHQVANVKKTTLLVGKLELEDSGEMLEKIPFNLVEEIPLFKKCENEPLIKQAKCFDQQMSKHILRHFNYPEQALNKGIEGRVLAQFTINQLGDVEDIRLRGPKGGELLEGEAKRLIEELPKFVPGKHNGKSVKVKYGIPITFRVPGSKRRTTVAKRKPVRAKKAAPTVKEEVFTNVVKFNKVQSIPQFKACSNASDFDKLNCFNERMISHIQRNFHYPSAAARENIEGKVWVTFVINSQGKVKNIKMRGPKNGELLEIEAQRMVSKLPDFIPGKHDGKFANVQYTIPINFKLN
ncbi:TonB family C-terminal domain-containing protein [Tenacibaculum sp. MAR_2009_124]|uniref:energy transducer TonB n=1 Tax=Tenacibaculum sp. MAR_2009_124 TaxID=1250059 RepID=UPI0008989CAB|nr:energy transducer TonB [Tenacibaculum sp. MAR_2009_124]SEC90810.1 TonB family C-terminal domain-containing protein [Tenacibaculum sp. MAR_2009_124]